MTATDYIDGQVILIDKPLEWTSFQVVNKVRWLIRKQYGLKKIKVGHAGTLDPLATGLLVICSGKYTKQIHTYQAEEKEYTGTFTLGATTPSFDLETEVDQTFDLSELTIEQIKAAATQFVGEIQQQPPVFSALKKDGKRLYEFAREGKQVDIPLRTIHISVFEITNVKLPLVEFRVVCSKGTYIRSLAHDLGRGLNNGAHLSSLRRTKSGSYSVEDALSIEAFEQQLTS